VSKLSKQGVPLLDGPRNGRRRDVPALFGVCSHHRYLVVADQDSVRWDVCTKCGHSRPADASRGFR
jgi:hypothetical protein